MSALASVPGSRPLRCRPRRDVEDVVHGRGGQRRCGVRVLGDAVPVVLDAFDRLAPLLEADEQCVYLHLYRLSIARELDICRASYGELTRRTRLSPRVLRRVLAALVAKQCIELVDRDVDGTVFRVSLPHVVLGTEPPPGVEVAGVGEHRVEKRTGGDLGTLIRPHTVESLTQAVVALWGEVPGRARADVASAIEALAASGRSSYSFGWDLIDFYEQTPRKVPIADLPSFVARHQARQRLSDADARGIDDA
jgi:hypothetical protein